MHLQQPNMDNKPSKNFFPSLIRDILSFSFEKRKKHSTICWQAARNAISRWWSWLSHYVIKIYRNARVFFSGNERARRKNGDNERMSRIPEWMKMNVSSRLKFTVKREKEINNFERSPFMWAELLQFSSTRPSCSCSVFVVCSTR